MSEGVEELVSVGVEDCGIMRLWDCEIGRLVPSGIALCDEHARVADGEDMYFVIVTARRKIASRMRKMRQSSIKIIVAAHKTPLPPRNL